eukprot:377934_1
MFISLVVILFVSFYNVNARTCVCAQFTPDLCEGANNCLWHTDTLTRGVCRSQKWMDCHNAPDCTIETHQTSDQEQDEQEGTPRRRFLANQDWPYSCDDSKGTVED